MSLVKKMVKKLRATGLPVERRILRLPRAKHIKIVSKKFRTLAYSRRFKLFIKKNKGPLVKAFRLIEEKFGGLARGAVIESSEGIRIEKAATGSYKGVHNLLTAKVTFAGKQFFVKNCRSFAANENLSWAIKADEYLKKQDYKIGGFNVRVLMPHLVYLGREKAYVVSDFFSESEVAQVCDYRGKKHRELKSVLNHLRKTVAKQELDLIDLNAFYQPATRTILLFDLM